MPLPMHLHIAQIHAFTPSSSRTLPLRLCCQYLRPGAQMEGREVSPDTEPEDDAEAEDVRPLPAAAEGAAIAQTAAPSGAVDPLS